MRRLVGSQHPEQRAQLGERATGVVGDRIERRHGGRLRFGRPGRVGARSGAGTGLGLDHDHAHVVGDDVVQLAGEMGALGQLGGAQLSFVVLFGSSGAGFELGQQGGAVPLLAAEQRGEHEDDDRAPSVGGVGVTRQQERRVRPRPR